MQKEFLDKITTRALEEGRRRQVAITVAIVDQSGRLRFLYRMEGCSYFAIEVSRKKAVTSSQLKIPSKVAGEIGQKYPLLKESFESNDEITGLPGGFPIRMHGQIIGGIGVAGGDFEQDHSIAEFAVQE